MRFSADTGPGADQRSVMVNQGSTRSGKTVPRRATRKGSIPGFIRLYRITRPLLHLGSGMCASTAV